MRHASVAIAFFLSGATALAGCSQHEEGEGDFIGVEVHSEYGNPKLLIELQNPWYRLDYSYYSRTDFNCDRWRDQPDWWLKASVKTTDGRLIGQGNWTRMDCQGDYDLFIRTDGRLELALQPYERKYHEEPIPVPTR